MSNRATRRKRAQQRLVSGAASSNKPVVSEIIGRATTPFNRVPVTWRKTVDESRPEYDFWSRLARGKEPGYELGALFAKRIAEIDAEWTLGDGFTVESDNSDVDELVNIELVQDNLDTLMTWRKDASKVGDAYIIVNPDGSLSLANPDTVEIITDPLDYTTVIGYKIITVLDTATITDEYRLDGRTVTFEKISGTRAFGTDVVLGKVALNFQNLTGMMPVIHLPNDKEANEIYGHPIYEALLTLFGRYDDVIQKTGDGVEIMGRPIPVAEGLDDPELAMQQNSTTNETVTNRDGSQEEKPVVDFEDLTMLWLGKGGSFKFAAPGSFSEDSMALLKKYFYLMLEHTGIPEWAWGGAVAGGIGGNSTMAQMPAFVKYLKGRRTATHKAVKQLVDVWLATKRLTTFVPAAERVQIVWPELERMDEKLQLDKIKEANLNGDLTQETHLRLLDLVDDPEGEIDAAKEEQQTEDAAAQARLDAELTAMNAGDGNMNPAMNGQMDKQQANMNPAMSGHMNQQQGNTAAA